MPYSTIKCGDGCQRVNNNQNNIIMSNERTGVDRVLDWIVPIRLSGKWMSVEVERGVKSEDYAVSYIVGYNTDSRY